MPNSGKMTKNTNYTIFSIIFFIKSAVIFTKLFFLCPVENKESIGKQIINILCTNIIFVHLFEVGRCCALRTPIWWGAQSR